MAKKIKLAAVLFTAGTAVLSVLYLRTGFKLFLSLAITFGTFAYHFLMRLLEGGVYALLM